MRCTLPSYRRARSTDNKETGNEEGWHRGNETEREYFPSKTDHWPGSSGRPARAPFHSEVKRQVAKQIALAEPRTPNLHRANGSLLESANGSMARAAAGSEKKLVHRKQKVDLTPTGLLMEGDYTGILAGSRLTPWQFSLQKAQTGSGCYSREGDFSCLE